MRKILLFIILTLSIFTLSACDNDARYITWNFNNANAKPYVQKVRYGQKISKLDRNIVDKYGKNEGHRVEYWVPKGVSDPSSKITFPYLIKEDATFDALWVFEKPTKNTKFVEIRHKINNRESLKEDFIIKIPRGSICNNEVAPRLPDTVKYRFIGWFTDGLGKNGFNPTIPITNDIRLYAKWEIKN